tara:strand:+ start:51 stop:1082 length:1032 start_codon:yes stop_codon:yes gene_type:complete
MEYKHIHKDSLSYNLFERADQPLLDWIRQKAIVRTFDTSNCQVIQEGSSNDGLYLVEAGALNVLSQQKNDRNVVIANLKPGDLFGEMSWLEERPTVASIEAEAGTRLFHIPINELNKLKRSGDLIGHLLYRSIAEKLALQLQSQNSWIHRDKSNRIEPLRKVFVLFAELNEKDVSLFSKIGHFKRLAPGQVLIKEGDEVKSLYLLLAGDAQISICEGNKRKYVGSSRRGELLGEMTMLNPSQNGAAANVETKNGLELLLLNKSELLNNLKSDQSMANRFYRGLARMLSQRNRDQLLSQGLSEASRLAEEDVNDEEITESQLSAITTAGIRFDWLCRQFQNQEG